MWLLDVSWYGCTQNGRGTGPGTAAHWEAQPPVVAQRAAAALRTRPLPQPTASSLVVESFFVHRVRQFMYKRLYWLMTAFGLSVIPRLHSFARSID